MIFNSIKDITSTYSPAKLYDLKAGKQTLAQLVGFSPSDRLLIINVDDFGLCESTNQAADKLLASDLVTSISLIAGAAGYEHALTVLNEQNCSTGIHLSLTSEWQGRVMTPILPINKIDSLLDPEGNFYSEIRDLYLQADNNQVVAECRAQIEKVLESKIPVDHLDTHMGVMQLRPDFVDLYISLAQEYNLPLRLGSENLARIMSLPVQQVNQACNSKVVFPDNLIYIPMSFTADKQTRFEAYDFAVRNIPAGVSEIYFHPTLNGDDYQNLQHAYSQRKDFNYETIRIWDYEYLTSGRLERILDTEKIIKTSYAKLSEIQHRLITL